MNAAARLLSQGALSRGWVMSVFLNRKQLPVVFMVFTVVVSALSLVYVTNLSRSLNASLQQTLVERDHLHVEWEQLLLEEASWVTQARVQNRAETKLGMVMPDSSSVVVVNP